MDKSEQMQELIELARPLIETHPWTAVRAALQKYDGVEVAQPPQVGSKVRSRALGTSGVVKIWSAKQIVVVWAGSFGTSEGTFIGEEAFHAACDLC